MTERGIVADWEARLEAQRQRALDAVERSARSDRMKGAIRLAADGISYRCAARQAGFKSAGSVYRAVRSFGLASVHERQRIEREDVRAADALADERAELRRLDDELWREITTK